MSIAFQLLRAFCTEASSLKENLARHLYHPRCEEALNQQIVSEINASLAYLSMAAYFGRSEIALPGCFGYFFRMHEEEMGHSYKLLRYQNMRGGCVQLDTFAQSRCSEWNIGKALHVSLEMEKLIKEQLMSMYDVAECYHDLNLMDFIVAEFIVEQEKSIAEFGRLLHRYRSLENNSHAPSCSCIDYIFDKEMHDTFVVKSETKKDSLLSEERAYK